MIRLLHTTAAFLVVATAYLVYAATIVPLVEPQRRGPGLSDPDGLPDDLFAPESKYADLFDAIFPADHWTNTNSPKVFEADKGMFVFRDYQAHGPRPSIRDDNQLLVQPCAIIYFPTPWSRGSGPPPTDCIVLEAPQGGVVELDGPIEIFKKLPRPKNARLMGPVVIKSDMNDPGPEDDLEITTSDVAVNELGVWSDAAVELQLGPHRGSGQTLEIRFFADASGNDPDSLNVKGIQWVRLLRDVRLVLQHNAHTSSAALGFTGHREPLAVGSESTGQIELTCDGPLYVDVPQRVAEFERDVEVFVIHANGPSDRLACENLRVAFADRRQVPEILAAPPKTPVVNEPPHDIRPAPMTSDDSHGAAENRLAAFQPVRFVATGQPVTVTSALRQVRARCRKLEYDVPLQKLTFEALAREGGPPTESASPAQQIPAATTEIDQVCDLQLGPHRLTAPQIEYTLDSSDPHGRLGTLRVSGAGRLIGANEQESPSQPFEATWHDGLQLVRQDDQPVLSLFGRPQIEGTGVGRMAAGELHVWLRESVTGPASAAGVASSRSPHPTGADATTQVVPDRLLARDNVAIDAPQLTARVGQLEAWLVSADRLPPRAPHEGGPALAPSRHHNLFGANEVVGPQKSYYVECDRLQIRALLPQRPAEGHEHVNVTHLTLIGSVLFEERPQPEQHMPSVRIEADRLEAADVHTASMFVIASGDPVVVHADGRTLRGGAVHFDQTTNRFDVPTPGDLRLTVDHDLERRPLAKPLPLTVSWQGRLQFDGREAILTDGVLVSTPEQRLQTQKIVATLGASVPLGRLQVDGQVDFEKLECTGGVVLDRRTFDAGGLASQEHAEFPNLTIERHQNRISALGPGWLRHVGLRRGEQLWSTPLGRGDARMAAVAARPMPTTTPAGPPPNAASQVTGLTYLRVDFQRAMEGNLQTRDVTFQGQVRCVQGPVASWDHAVHVDGLAELPEDTFVVHSSTLRVGQRQMQASAWHEIEAEGNVEVEACLGDRGNFFANGARLTYDQRKDLLILDGGAGMVEVVREESVGGKREHGHTRKIQYSPDRRSFSTDGIQQITGGF